MSVLLLNIRYTYKFVLSPSYGTNVITPPTYSITLVCLRPYTKSCGTKLLSSDNSTIHSVARIIIIVMNYRQIPDMHNPLSESVSSDEDLKFIDTSSESLKSIELSLCDPHGSSKHSTFNFGIFLLNVKKTNKLKIVTLYKKKGKTMECPIINECKWRFYNWFCKGPWLFFLIRLRLPL